MTNQRTPSASDASTLDIQQRNDNTTLDNTVPEYPDRSNGNEFEVEKRNEVYPNQTPNTELTEDEKHDKKMNSGTNSAGTNSTDKKDEDWDITKNKVNPENEKANDENTKDREQSSSKNMNSKNSEDDDTEKSGLAETE